MMEKEVMMEAPPTTPPDPNRHRRIASPLHTILVLGIQVALAIQGAMNSARLQSPNLDRVRLYERTIFSEWSVFVVVILGVWFSGSPLTTVLGERWRSVRQVLRDLGIAVVFLIVSITIGSTVGSLLGGDQPGQTGQSILPHQGSEIPLWIVLSITAGICEEAIYRGYLQRQFMALTNNAPAGIVLSAAVFGGSHAYQGFSSAFQIGLLGVMLGALAHWRKTVRPGMIAHAAQDVMAVFIRH
jgi:membrane protease YdiL (CAAX protease family)